MGLGREIGKRSRGEQCKMSETCLRVLLTQLRTVNSQLEVALGFIG